MGVFDSTRRHGERRGSAKTRRGALIRREGLTHDGRDTAARKAVHPSLNSCEFAPIRNQMARRTKGVHFEKRLRGQRYPIRQAIEYKVLNGGAAVLQGTGTTLDFSMSGLQFTTESELPIGCLVELSVDWPAVLNAKCALQFVGTGQVVRSEGNRAGVDLDCHEFRERGKSGERRDGRIDTGPQRRA
jgi:hypothetical protein